MDVHQAVFIKSAVKPKDFPLAELPEVAFVGRSNVGKSSLINVLAGRKSLVRTSSTPGRTQLINFFDINGILTGPVPKCPRADSELAPVGGTIPFRGLTFYYEKPACNGGCCAPGQTRTALFSSGG